MPAQELEYEVLTLPELDDAISGYPDDNNAIVPPRLLSPKLKYYMRPSPLLRGKDSKYLFLMATAALTLEEQEDCWSKHPEQMRKPVGLLELEWSPHEEGVVWLKYITVEPAWQKRGIAHKLVDNMVTVLSQKNCRIDRSRPSDEGLAQIKSYIDKVLDGAGISWTQSPPL